MELVRFQLTLETPFLNGPEILETISPGSQQLVDFFGGGSELPEFSLIPADPIAIIFFIVILISLLVPTWMAPEPKQ